MAVRGGRRGRRSGPLPDAEPRALPVGGQCATPLAQGQWAHGHGAAALTDPGGGRVGVLDGEVRRPRHRDAEGGRHGADPGDGYVTAPGDRELLAELARPERPAHHRAVELLGGIQVPGHQIDPAGCRRPGQRCGRGCRARGASRHGPTAFMGSAAGVCRWPWGLHQPYRGRSLPQHTAPSPARPPPREERGRKAARTAGGTAQSRCSSLSRWMVSLPWSPSS